MLLAAATMENRKPPMVCQQSDERSSLVAPSRDARATPKRSNSLKYASLCTLALVGTCAAIAGPHRAARPLEAAGITNPSPEKTSHVERSSSRRALLAMHDGYGSPPPDTTTTYDETYYSYPDSSPDVYYASPPTTEPRRRSRDPDCPDETYDETYYSYPDHDDGDWDHDDHDDHDHDHDHDHKPDRDRDHPPEGSDDGPDPGAMFAVAAVVGVVFAAVFALCCRLCRRSRTENTKVVVFDYPATVANHPGNHPGNPPAKPWNQSMPDARAPPRPAPTSPVGRPSAPPAWTATTNANVHPHMVPDVTQWAPRPQPQHAATTPHMVPDHSQTARAAAPPPPARWRPAPQPPVIIAQPGGGAFDAGYPGVPSSGYENAPAVGTPVGTAPPMTPMVFTTYTADVSGASAGSPERAAPSFSNAFGSMRRTREEQARHIEEEREASRQRLDARRA